MYHPLSFSVKRWSRSARHLWFHNPKLSDPFARKVCVAGSGGCSARDGKLL